MQGQQEQRVVMTLDAGGTNFIFSAIAANAQVVTPVAMAARVDDINQCLVQIVDGFMRVKDQLKTPPAAISFAFPGPCDYERGIVGDLGNLPCFRGGVALGPMLEEIFNIPTYINNDGDLFAYGEGVVGLLPRINKQLAIASAAKRYNNLLAVTLGTGFGGGLYSRGRLYVGDNGAGCEIWCNKDPAGQYQPVEERVSIRAVRKNYARLLGIPFEQTPQPKDIFDIAMQESTDKAKAARQAFAEMGQAFGDVLADLVNLTDGLIVVGGGLAGAHPLILPAAVKRMNEPYVYEGRTVPRMESICFNLEDPAEAARFLRGEERMIQVPRSKKQIPYDPQKRVGIAVSKLGTSEAIAIGAYSFALAKLEAKKG